MYYSVNITIYLMGFYVLSMYIYLGLFHYTNISNLRLQQSEDNKLLSEFGKIPGL